MFAPYSVPDDESEQTLFDDVQQDSDVCNNCFRRTHSTYERNFVVDTFRPPGSNTSELWAREVDLPDRAWTEPGKTDYVPQDPASRGTSVTCICGTGDAMRPVSKDDAMEHAKRLYERLREYGADVDRGVLLDEVRARMSEPENQCRFDSELKEAVTVAQCSNVSDDGSH